MKKIVTPGVGEEAEHICDVTGKPAVGKLFMTFDYGSRHDLQVLEMDLSDEAADEILQFLQAKSPAIKLRACLKSSSRREEAQTSWAG